MIGKRNDGLLLVAPPPSKEVGSGNSLWLLRQQERVPQFPGIRNANDLRVGQTYEIAYTHDKITPGKTVIMTGKFLRNPNKGMMGTEWGRFSMNTKDGGSKEMEWNLFDYDVTLKARK